MEYLGKGKFLVNKILQSNLYLTVALRVALLEESEQLGICLGIAMTIENWISFIKMFRNYQ